MLYQQRVTQGVEKLMKWSIPRLPSALKWAATIAPRNIQQATLLRGLNYALRTNIMNGDLAFFSGKILTVCITDIGVEFSMTYKNTALIAANSSLRPDVGFGASSYDLLLIATQRLDPDMLFFQRRLEMNGDTELGLGIKNLLASIDINTQLNTYLARSLLHFSDWVERYRA